MPAPATPNAFRITIVHQGTVALGIRNVVCVPLNAVLYVESADANTENRRIGVLYLDSREKGTLLSSSTRKALDAMASEASAAIQNAGVAGFEACATFPAGDWLFRGIRD